MTDCEETFPDPVVIAERAARAAERHFLALPVNSVSDEMQPEFKRAEAHLDAAERALADAIPSTPRGALVKLRALRDLCEAASGRSRASLEIRHIRALMSYLQRLEAEDTAGGGGEPGAIGEAGPLPLRMTMLMR
jgi:hypothetical protein